MSSSTVLGSTLFCVKWHRQDQSSRGICIVRTTVNDLIHNLSPWEGSREKKQSERQKRRLKGKVGLNAALQGLLGRAERLPAVIPTGVPERGQVRVLPLISDQCLGHRSAFLT